MLRLDNLFKSCDAMSDFMDRAVTNKDQHLAVYYKDRLCQLHHMIERRIRLNKRIARMY